jgi:hypothetical protein
MHAASWAGVRVCLLEEAGSLVEVILIAGARLKAELEAWIFCWWWCEGVEDWERERSRVVKSGGKWWYSWPLKTTGSLGKFWLEEADMIEVEGAEGPAGTRRFSGLPNVRLLRSCWRAAARLLEGEEEGVEGMIAPAQEKEGGKERRDQEPRARAEPKAEPRAEQTDLFRKMWNRCKQ